MARETQGLQIAMIVFVLLTIVFGVSTFIFFSQYREADKRATATDQKAKENSDAAREALQRVDELKQMMGFGPSDTVESIREKFNGDMDKFAKTYPKEMQFYKPAIERLAKALEEKDESLTNEQATVAQLKAQLAAQIETTKLEIAKHDKSAQDAQQDKQTQIEQFTKDREKLTADLAKMDATLKKTQKDRDATETDLNNKLAVALDANKAMGGHVDNLKTIVNDMRRDTPPEKFQGEVRRVSQHQGVVWINLGRADSLRPRTTFRVYAAGSGEITEVGKKASIEVTQVLDNHLAEARILDDQADNPIVPGDKIFTPVWSLGEKRHFAIAGLIDLNGDGQHDPEELRRLCTLIEMNGGVVDAPLDAQGKREGKMTLDTRYLILGKRPDETASADQLADLRLMMVDSEKLRVEQIDLEKFLDRMGWRRDSQVVSFTGEGSTPIRPDERPRVSGGKISDVFKPREPPRSSGGSTF